MNRNTSHPEKALEPLTPNLQVETEEANVNQPPVGQMASFFSLQSPWEGAQRLEEGSPLNAK